MSAVSDACRVAVLVGDFASQDGGKVGVLGGAWIFTASPTPPQAVVAIVEVPGEHLNEQFALELILYSEHGPVTIPDPLTGAERTLRVAQNLTAFSVPGLPKKAANKVHFVVNMGPGLPLTPDHIYTWRVLLDGETRDDWQTSFYVLQTAADVVVG